MSPEDKTRNLASHTLENDPPHSLSAVSRKTCSRCGCAVLTHSNGHTYGSALETHCDTQKASNDAYRARRLPMSYEGYVQCLCKNGHLYTVDAWEEDDVCPSCKAPRAWSNGVDQTNGDEDGHIDMKHFLVKEAVVETCNMGHGHITSEAVYRVPSKDEVDKVATYRDWRTNKTTYIASGKPVDS